MSFSLKKLAFRNLKIRQKLLVVGLVLTLVPLLAVGVLSFVQNIDTKDVAEKESLKLANADMEHVARSIHRLASTHHEMLMKNLEGYINVMQQLIADSGGLSLSNETATWTPMHQDTLNFIKPTRLPKMMLGNQWLGQEFNPKATVLLVDKIKQIFPITGCSIMQRMNEEGDMLRVASNTTVKFEGADVRTISTFTPAMGQDGQPNPMISTVLKGERYIGSSTLLGAAFLTAYEPIFDAKKNVIGIIGIGQPRDPDNSMKNAIRSTRVAKTGYVYVTDSKANMLVHPDTRLEGMNFWNLKDADGNLWVQDMLNKYAGATIDNPVAYEYNFQHPGEKAPTRNIAMAFSFTPWDWSIQVTAKKDEFLDSVNQIDSRFNTSIAIMGLVIFFSMVASGLIWFLVSGGISKPILKISETVGKIAKEKDLTLEVPVESEDETGVMAAEFNNMSTSLRNTFKNVVDAAKKVALNAEDVAQRASANKERAENQEKQMSIMEETIKAMGATAGEVAGASGAQKESAEISNQNIVGLLGNMDTVSDASLSQIKEANEVAQKVEAMGETGGKVVNTAGKQGEAANKVSEAVIRISNAVEEMTAVAKRSTEYGRQVLSAAEEGAETVNATVAGMRAIAESSDQISEIITVITDIAEQTNLLSLNAAIEAARAGVHGRGFAVVADEVGKLAQRSSEAAKEITMLIKDSTTRVNEGTHLTDKSQAALRKIAEGGQINMRAIEEISASTKLLVDGTQEVSRMVLELNSLAHEIASMAGQQGERRQAAQRAIGTLMTKSNEISQLVDKAGKSANEISGQMKDITDRTDDMKKLTDIQAERSKKLIEISVKSAQSAKQTMEGASTVFGISEDLRQLSANLIKQVEQFRI